MKYKTLRINTSTFVFFLGLTLLVTRKAGAETRKASFENKTERQQTLADIVVTGTVLDSKGVTLPGVTVKIKGTALLAITNSAGKFSIKVPDKNAVMIFSFVGFETQELKVGDNKEFKVTLTDKNNDLNEVVVVGYGTQKKQTVVGAISSIGTKELVQSPVANISNSLVGRLPGLFATQGSGEPGNDASTLRLRGIGTFSGSSDPLILVDGIEALSFNNIDPNEVESITILKDASSTAVYGIRGANGVIIITTKRGQKGKPVVSYSFQNAINSFTKLRHQMNSADYAASLNLAVKNDAYVTNSVYVPRYSDADLQKFRDGSDPLFYPNTDWADVILKKTSGQQQHNLNIRGGTEDVQYFISTGYFSQEGLFRDTRNIVPDYDSNTKFRRLNIRSNFNFNVNKRFRIRFDASSQTEYRNGNNATTQNVIEYIGRANPVSSSTYDNKVVNLSSINTNVLTQLLSAGYQHTTSNYLNGLLRLDHDLDFLLKGLTVHADVAYQNYNQQKIVNQKTLVQYLAQKVTQPDGSTSTVLIPQQDDGAFSFSEINDKYRRITAEAGIDYKRSFGNHAVTALVVYNQNKLYNPNLAFQVPKGYQSLAGRTTYSYKNKYLTEFDLAYNGTEQFAPGKRFGYFPAMSAGWIPTEEKFFPKNKIVTYIKIRGSYGQVGNDQIGGDRFLYRPTAFTSVTPVLQNGQSTIPAGYYFGTVGQNYLAYNGLVEGKAGNPNLTWERANKRDIGVDLKFFQDHLNVTGDYFSESRSNILAVPSTISNIIGFSLPAYNLGKMTNKGFEVDMGYNNRIGAFNYNIGGNFSYARNKIVYQDELTQPYAYEYRTGQRIGQTFGYVAEGLFNSWAEVNDPNRPVYALLAGNRVQPGDIRYKDINGDGIINTDDQVPIGYSTVPEITYGISLRGSIKGFDFSVLFQGVSNVSAPFSSAYGRNFITGFFGNPVNGAADYLINSWTPERYAQGQTIEFPRFSAGQNFNYTSTSTYLLQDASYLRLKNVEVGYTFKAGVLAKVGLKSARIYANANNLYTWSHLFHGVDPESVASPLATGVTGSGASLATNNEPYPLVRTINFGLSVNF